MTIIRSYKSLVLLLLACSLFNQCKSQNENTRETPYQHETVGDIPVVDSYFYGNSTITSDKGPASITRNVLQDKNGIFWFASWEGIVSYDGKEFTNHTNKHELSRYRAFALLEDQKGQIWIGTVGAGLFKYDGEKFTQYTIDDGLASNTIGCLFQNKKGDLWVGTLEGISKLKGDKFLSFNTDEGGVNDDVNSIIEDKDGLLWIGTRGKLVKFDGATFTEVKNNDQSDFYNVRSICKSKFGTIWIGGNNGLNAFDGSKWTNHLEDFTGHIFEDSKQNIWLSKSSKTRDYAMTLTKFEVPRLPLTKLTQTEILSPDGQVFGITEDNQGNIWFGLENGVARYDGKLFEYFK